MTGVKRQLFWKVYLTLLASLIVVTMTMGGVWWLLGEPRDHPPPLRIDLSDGRLTSEPAGPALAALVQTLGRQTDANISLYDQQGKLLATRGRPIAATIVGDEQVPWPHLFTRLELPGGRLLLAHTRPPADRRFWHMLTSMLFVAGSAALAAFPITARLTRRLERLRLGMARWGEGDIWTRVDESGSDEVAAVARTFNAAAERINALLTSQRALLANASHELRSPLARLRLAVELSQNGGVPAGRDEIIRNLLELDELVDEILLSSRLEHPGSSFQHKEDVDLLGLAAEEAARVGAQLEGEPTEIAGNEMLIRRLIRNLLENGLKHGRPPVSIAVHRDDQEACLIVSDGGAGIPLDERERVFEPFYRPAGRSEGDGGWGLGLSLVRQIALRHGGHACCEEGEASGGSRMVVRLPLGQVGATFEA